jgi:phosphoribosylaminoimidazole (AIR) synthetase
VAVVPSDQAAEAVGVVDAAGRSAAVIGHIEAGGGVRLI